MPASENGRGTNPIAFLDRSPAARFLAVAALLALGLGLRLLDLTDPPLDFHPDRQLRAGVIARGMYYQMSPAADPAGRERAIALWQAEEVYEPRLFERLVALTYLAAGSEHLWIARIYAALFWVAGGAALYALARSLTSTIGALVALGYFLLLPFGVVASRSFQPEPLMVMWVVISAYLLYRWAEQPTWGRSAAAGLASGMAVLVKVTAAFPIAGMALAAVLASRGFRQALKDGRVWLLAALMVALPSAYYLFTIGGRSAGYFRYWSVSLASLLTQPWFYVRWLNQIHYLVDLGLALIGLVGVLLVEKRTGRALLLGLWGGYLLYGLSLPYLIYTHDYYNLPLVPIVGLSLAPVAALALGRLPSMGTGWRLLLAGVIIVAVFYPSWNARLTLAAKDYRGEPAGWANLSAELPEEGPIIALTHDYGLRINYYGKRAVALWPYQGDLELAALQGSTPDPSFERQFQARTQGQDYFLVTLPGALEGQPALKAALYDGYPLVIDRRGLQLFDLRRPLNGTP